MRLRRDVPHDLLPLDILGRITALLRRAVNAPAERWELCVFKTRRRQRRGLALGDALMENCSIASLNRR